jgi:amino acid permease
MKIVVWRGSIVGVFLYASVGVFGYLTFYNKPQELQKQNILLAPYGNNIAIIIVRVLIVMHLGAIHILSFGVFRNAFAISPVERNCGGDHPQR